MMILSGIGTIAEKYWYEIPTHFPFVDLGAFVVMPNHIHGIIIIDKSNEIMRDNYSVETPNLGVSTDDAAIDNKNDKWESGNLGVIINQYKRICTIHSRKIKPDFAWQSRFYDHIVRDDESYHRISEYIINNPLNWEKDDYYVGRDALLGRLYEDNNDVAEIGSDPESAISIERSELN
ncbi:MAG: hypothetical protein ABIF11_10860 [Nitrospirota bacterium]